MTTSTDPNFITEFPRSFSPDVEGAILQQIDLMLNESRSERSRADALMKGEENLEWFNNGDWGWVGPAGQRRIVIQRIQQSVRQIVSTLIGQDPNAKFTGRVGDDTPTYFLRPDQLPPGVLQQLQSPIVDPTTGQQTPPLLTPDVAGPFTGTDGQQYPQNALTPQQVQAIQNIPGAGDALKPIDDDVVSKSEQDVYDGLCEDSGYKFIALEACKNSQIIGWQDVFVGWNFDQQIPTFLITEPKAAFTEPIRTDIARSSYYLYEEMLGADESNDKYPKWMKVVDAERATGLPSTMLPGGQPASYFNVSWRRELIRILHCYVKDQVIDLHPDDALQMGLVVQQNVPDAMAGDEDEQPSLMQRLMRGAKSIFGKKDDDAADEQSAEPDSASPEDSATAGEGSGDQQSPPSAPSRSAFFLNTPSGPDTDTREIHPGTPQSIHPTTGDVTPATAAHALWPTKRCVLYVAVVEGHGPRRVVAYEDSKWNRIPFSHLVSNPVPRTYFGHGSVSLLIGPQTVINNCATDSSSYINRFGGANVTINQSTAQALGEENITNAYKLTGKVAVLPDVDFAACKGQAFAIQEVPPPPDFALELLNTMVPLCDKIAGNNDPSQGAPTAEAKSGIAIQSLQQANVTNSLEDALLLERFLTYNAELITHGMRNFMGVQDWAKYVDDLQPHELQEVIRRSKLPGRKVKIMVRAGGGTLNSQEEQNTLNKFQAGIITKTTTQERLGENPVLERENEAAEALAQARNSPMSPTVPGQPAPTAVQSPAA